jgi:hypothetical protein
MNEIVFKKNNVITVFIKMKVIQKIAFMTSICDYIDLIEVRAAQYVNGWRIWDTFNGRVSSDNMEIRL